MDQEISGLPGVISNIKYQIYRMGRFKKAGLVLISAVLNLLAGGVIYYFWQPIKNWYWRYRPILGVDFYNAASYVGYLIRHFAFKFNGWRFNWWGGSPLAYDAYPTLHFYLILPFLKFFSLVQAIQVYMLTTFFLFLFFSYLLFWEIGKDRVLAVILAIASSFSVALYGPLVWGGSLPYFATQFFLPLVIWCLVKYLNTKSLENDTGSKSYLRSGIEKKDRRWFYLSSLFLGISFLGHIQVGFSYTVPICFFLLFFYPFPQERLFSGKRAKRLFLYLLMAVVIGYPQLATFVGYTPLAILLKIPGTMTFFLGRLFPKEGEALPGVVATTSPEAIAQIAEFQKKQLGRLITETNSLFFVFLAAGAFILLLSFVMRKKKRDSFKILVFALPVLWTVFYNWLYAHGISIFHGGWYRAFWAFPLSLGILISFIWGDFWASIKERLGVLGQKPIFSLLMPIVSGIIILAPGLVLVSQNPAQKIITKIENPVTRQQSSAFPDSLGVYIEKERLEKLKGKLTPSWLNPNETNYRLYEADQRVNIWWSAFFNMPLVKGYIEPPPGDSSGGFYWLSIALSQFEGKDTLVETWGVPPEMAYNNALFLIDWYSAKFIEAEHEKSDSYNPLASYLAKTDIFAKREKVVIPGFAQLYMIDNGQPISWHPEEEEYLTYYEIKDKLVSPITHTTNASVVGVIGAVDAYRTILRALAAANLNSRQVIPLDLGQFIDDVPNLSLKEMDAVVLYSYDYKNHAKAWGKLEKYVKEGGRVLVETGSEVKQTESVSLPAKYPQELPSIFPLKTTKQEEMGKEWQLSSEAEETEEISLEAFGPPILDGEPWLFSQPSSAGDLREGTKVILANKGTPLVASWQYGQGEVIWSGLNLPYHLTVHKNMEEANFFKNLLENFISTEAVNYADYSVERKSTEKMIVKGKGARGVIFREQDYPGWQAEVISNIKYEKSNIKKQKLKIYRTGPTYPGFMYVVVPKEMRDSDFEVTFSFRGDFWGYLWSFISLMTVIILLDRIIFNSRLLTPWVKIVSAPLMKRVGGWWEKEDY